MGRGEVWRGIQCIEFKVDERRTEKSMSAENTKGAISTLRSLPLKYRILFQMIWNRVVLTWVKYVRPWLNSITFSCFLWNCFYFQFSFRGISVSDRSTTMVKGRGYNTGRMSELRHCWSRTCCSLNHLIKHFYTSLCGGYDQCLFPPLDPLVLFTAVLPGLMSVPGPKRALTE